VFKKILLPTDGSPLANMAALAGVKFACELGAEVIGIFVAPEYRYPIYVEVIPPDFPTQEEYEASMRETGEVYFADIRKAAVDAGLKFTGITLFSDATAKAIADTADEQQCDLIFMGSHGRSGWAQLLLGSVTSKVLALARIPVLVFRVKEQPGARALFI
jgi:nucleotide-binding universal stress UspA family protein